MNGQEDFFDIPSSKRTPAETRTELVKLALPIVGQDKEEELADLLAHKTTPNGGNAVTNDLKYTSMFGPDIVVGASLTLNSQVLPSEFDPCLPNGPLGWSRCKRCFQRLGREGVDPILQEQYHGLDKVIKLNTWCATHSVTDLQLFEFSFV